MARRYYLSHPRASQGIDTIYVLDADDEEGACYLCERIGAKSITRQYAIRLARVHGVSGRGAAWCRSEDRSHQPDASDVGDHLMIQAAIDDAAAATAALIRCHREMDGP